MTETLWKPDNRTYHRKDMTVECGKCGSKQSVAELIDNGECDFDIDIIYPCGFNPFIKKGCTDRISIPYDCHCSECGEYIRVDVVCSAFAVDIYGEELEVLKSEYTEPMTEEDGT